jgi:signal peptidase I
MVLPAISLYYLITEHLVSINKAEGESMLPTIRNNEILIVDKFWIRWFALKKNDVIIA